MNFKALAATIGVATILAATSLTSAKTAQPTLEKNTIHIVEHAGYFETKGNVYDVEAGSYTFVVDNRSGKDAGFVLSREGQDPIVIGIENGKTGRVEAKLESGGYSYFCPIIPTPQYPIKVK